MDKSQIAKLDSRYNVRLRDYQIEAIDSWLDNGRKSILAMATGTGKTITAIAAMLQLAEENRRDSKSSIFVIVCPYIHLVDQWDRSLRRFGQSPVRGYLSRRKWLPDFEHLVKSIDLLPGRFGFVVTTNSTFASVDFQKCMKRSGKALVLVGDEVHNLGAKWLRELLPANASSRLGLSATPERWLDLKGTEALRTFFGPESYSLGIKESIKRNILVPYDYHPRACRLTQLETDEYGEVTQQLIRLLRGRDFDQLNKSESIEAAKFIRIRSSITGNAASKIPAMRQAISDLRFDERLLVFCAEGFSNNYPGGKQTDFVVDDLRNIGISSKKYESETPARERLEILRDFATGKLKAIVSMRCLDEGVDIPEARDAIFLASGSNPRQFVQRRGRVLRQSDGKNFATIVDLFVLTAPGLGREVMEFELNLVRRELDRVAEFIDASRNKVSGLLALREIRKEYGIHE